MCGNPNLDFDALQGNAKYEGGYSASTPVRGGGHSASTPVRGRGGGDHTLSHTHDPVIAQRNVWHGASKHLL